MLRNEIGSESSSSSDAHSVQLLEKYLHLCKIKISEYFGAHMWIFEFGSDEERDQFLQLLKSDYPIADPHVKTLFIPNHLAHAIAINDADIKLIKTKYLAKKQYTPISTPYLIKSLRGDHKNFIYKFTDQLLAIEKKPHDLRPSTKRAYTVKGDGVHLRETMQPQYSKEDKQGFSPIQSTSLVTEQVSPPAFYGLDPANLNKRVGVIIERKDALFNRMFIYDNGTINRPYDHDFKDDAIEYFNTKTKGDTPVLFASESAFSQALTSKANANKHNEVLARIRWNTDGTSKIFIGSTTLEAKLLAVDYARIIHKRVELYSRLQHKFLHPNYEIEICYYLPKSNTEHLSRFTVFDLLEAKASARYIADRAELRHEKYDSNNFEFLLGLTPDSIIAALKETPAWNETSIFKLIYSRGYKHILLSLIELCDTAFFADDTLLKELMANDELLYHVMARAAQYGNLNVLKKLLRSGASANHLYSNFPSLLSIATEHRQYDCMVTLLEYRANVSDNFNNHPCSLEMAARLGDTKAIEILLSYNAKVPQTWNTNPAVCHAAHRGHDLALTMLLDHGGNAEAFHKYYSPLQNAASSGHLTTVALLLKAGANINRKNELGDTALSLAIKCRHSDVVEYLAAHGATLSIEKSSQQKNEFIKSIEMNDTEAATWFIQNCKNAHEIANRFCDIKTGETALILAAKNNNEAITASLIKLNVDLNAQDHQKMTALHHAVTHKRAHAAMTLLDNAAQTDITDADGNTPLHAAAKVGNDALVKLLLQINISLLDKQNNHGDTALIYALRHDQVKTANVILDFKPDINTTNKHGKTALYYAAGLTSINVDHKFLIRLITAGAQLETKTPEGKTAVYQAAKHGCQNILQLLIAAKADVTVTHSTKKKTLLHLCAKRGSVDAISELAAHHIQNIDPLDHKNRTPLYCAIAKKYPRTASTLLAHGARVTGHQIERMLPSQSELRLLPIALQLLVRKIELKALIENMEISTDKSAKANARLESALLLFSATVREDKNAKKYLEDNPDLIQSDDILSSISNGLGFILPLKNG